MKTSAVRLQYCVLFSPSPLFPRQGLGACNLYHTPQPILGFAVCLMAGPLSCIQPVIVMLPIHVSVFCCSLICSRYLCLFLHAWLSLRAFGDGEGLWDGAGVIGWPYFVCASITSAECSSMQISLPLWEEAHVSEVINFTLECQLWCWCDVFQIELSHQKGVNLGIWQMN